MAKHLVDEDNFFMILSWWLLGSVDGGAYLTIGGQADT